MLDVGREHTYPERVDGRNKQHRYSLVLRTIHHKEASETQVLDLRNLFGEIPIIGDQQGDMGT